MSVDKLRYIKHTLEGALISLDPKSEYFETNYNNISNSLVSVDQLIDNDLLKKYMTLVKAEEGITFVDSINNPCSDIEFTEEEENILKSISKQIEK